jgi:GNAT superfamily N-acetyltransferase
MPLIIARGTIGDVPDADRIIRDVAAWLDAKGETLWGPNEISYDALMTVARAGELIVGYVGPEMAACMYMHNRDPEFWPEDKPGEAFYIHRLAVARPFAGRGFAHAMLAWAEGEARAHRRPYLRLDCVPRPKLSRLYEAAGFARVDPGPVKVGEHWVIRQQKHV